ncbi:MAG: AtpZ/AtpI family protein [Deltaproteobacteria bacterium]|nr:AtpZ/AtpI family protein [Deltaproteobacteria bacterium]
MNDWFRYGGIGVEMLASVLIGTLGGYGLDYLLNTRPWLMIVGFIFGSAAGFRSLFRLINQDQDKEKKD